MLKAFRWEGDYLCDMCIQPIIHHCDYDMLGDQVIEVTLRLEDAPVLCASCGKTLVELPETL